MNIGSAFKFAARVAGRTDPAPTPDYMASPWGGGNTLSKIVMSDVFGTRAPVASRADADKVPGISKARAVICGTLSRQPLAKFRGDVQLDPDPWMYRTNTAQSPQQRMLWTLDDLIFYGASLWAVQRGAKDQIVDAVRVLPDEWELDEDRIIRVHGQAVPADQVVLIEGPQVGLLDKCPEEILASIAMERAWAQRVQTPVPLVALKIEDQNIQLTEEETKDLVNSWEVARRSGGTAVLPYGLSMEVHGDVVADLFVSGRNMARLDWANHLNIPASLLEGSTSTASLTYSTKQDSRNEFVDYSLSYWSNAIAARLSMDDVVPAGQRVDFDISWLTDFPQPDQYPGRED